MQHLTAQVIVGLAVLAGIAGAVVFLTVEGLSRLRHGVWATEALRCYRPYRDALARIAAMPVTPGPTACITEAQAMRAIAARALSHDPAPPAAQGPEELIGMAMALHNLNRPTSGGGSDQRPPV